MLRCRSHGHSLIPVPTGEVEKAATLTCPGGCSVRVVRGIPRFVDASRYASGFGLQWNAYRRTQLDSETGIPISRARLTRCLGGSLETLRGARVLEVGGGAGRFTEIMIEAGAHVFACDLSDAVEANFDNCAGLAGPDHYFVAQADVNELPTAPGSFDVVVALGMIQHTPSPEQTILALAREVKPGGFLALDHYTAGTHGLLWRALVAVSPRSLSRQVLLWLPAPAALRVSAALTRALLPLHRACWRPGPLARAGRRFLRLVSPVFDYYDKLPQLSPSRLEEWALLDTHDGLTDRFKHLRTVEEIASALSAAGFEEITAVYAGNGVEARGRRRAAAPSVT